MRCQLFLIRFLRPFPAGCRLEKMRIWIKRGWDCFSVGHWIYDNDSAVKRRAAFGNIKNLSVCWAFLREISRRFEWTLCPLRLFSSCLYLNGLYPHIKWSYCRVYTLNTTASYCAFFTSVVSCFLWGDPTWGEKSDWTSFQKWTINICGFFENFSSQQCFWKGFVSFPWIKSTLFVCCTESLFGISNIAWIDRAVWNEKPLKTAVEISRHICILMRFHPS